MCAFAVLTFSATVSMESWFSAVDTRDDLSSGRTLHRVHFAIMGVGRCAVVPKVTDLR